MIAEREKRGVNDAVPGITGYAQVRKIDMSEPEGWRRLMRSISSCAASCLIYGSSSRHSDWPSRQALAARTTSSVVVARLVR